MIDRIRQLIQERERYLHCGDLELVAEIEEELRQMGYQMFEATAIQRNNERAAKGHPARRQI